MKKLLFTLFLCFIVSFSFAESILIEGFEYGNHDLETPVGWISVDNSWLAGYLDKDHNRTPHLGNWYAFTDSDDSWMFMELFMGTGIKYRYNFWCISDGEYDVEFWAGSGPSSSEMTTLLFTETVNTDEYQYFSDYIESIAVDYQYFGIHATAHEGAYHLTMDDIQVNMVGKYDISATPSIADTTILPNSQINYHFEVQNLGYEPFEVIISPSTDYFTDLHFFVEGNQCTTFHLEPDETKRVTAQATLLPSVEPGSICWLDITLVLDCNCATALTTIWVTVLDPSETSESKDNTCIFPNPANDFVNINAHGLQRIEVMDITGKKHISMTADHDNLRLDLSKLPAGIYFVTAITDQGAIIQKLVKQ